MPDWPSCSEQQSNSLCSLFVMCALPPRFERCLDIVCIGRQALRPLVQNLPTRKEASKGTQKKHEVHESCGQTVSDVFG